MTLSSADQHRLEIFWQYCVKNQFFNVGYPESADFDYAELHRFFRFSINNCGDWSESSNYLLNSFDFEKEIMQHFCALFDLSFQDSWGYVTNGGTEGNMFGCYLAREMFPQGVMYCSREAHYSVKKIARLLRINTRTVMSSANGEIDYDDLLRQVSANLPHNPIIFANIGSTMRGAIDNVTTIQHRLAQAGFARRDFYLHADAAMSGMILPFVDNPGPFTFADGIDSISVSAHKMIGCPFPCGIVVARRENVSRISVEVDYIGARDQTISGSRNGHAPLLMWAALRSRSQPMWRNQVRRCLDMAQYAVDQFLRAGVNAWRNPNSITVVFPRPSPTTSKKHGLAVSGHEAHLITSAHHRNTRKIDAVISDVVADLRWVDECTDAGDEIRRQLDHGDDFLRDTSTCAA